MAAAKKESTTIQIRPLQIERIKIRIVGDTPFITHAWSEKAKKMMLDAQTGAKSKTKKRPLKRPFDEFAQGLYWLTPKPEKEVVDANTGEKIMVIEEEEFFKAIDEGARFGFPANSFKKSAIAAAYRMGWIPNQTAMKAAFFLNAEDNGELVEIKGSTPVIREDMVKVGMGTADIRYRPEFPNWYCDMILEYNASGDFSLEDILTCLRAGGYGIGIGEWRPDRNGSFGRYHIETVG